MNYSAAGTMLQKYQRTNNRRKRRKRCQMKSKWKLVVSLETVEFKWPLIRLFKYLLLSKKRKKRKRRIKVSGHSWMQPLSMSLMPPSLYQSILFLILSQMQVIWNISSKSPNGQFTSSNYSLTSQTLKSLKRPQERLSGHQIAESQDVQICLNWQSYEGWRRNYSKRNENAVTIWS